jgi:RNA polymerase sigma factor (sigma-70 family)
MKASEAQLKELMVRGLNGDAAAHATLLRLLVPLLRAYFLRKLPGEGDAEDLVQETLISIHTRRATYDRDRALTPWLYAIARHRLIDHVRSRRIQQPLDGLEDVLAVDSFEDAALAHIDVETLLATLPPKQARAIRATRVEGKSVAEAAQDAGIGVSDVKVSVHRGLRALATRIIGQ